MVTMVLVAVVGIAVGAIWYGFSSGGTPAEEDEAHMAAEGPRTGVDSSAGDDGDDVASGSTSEFVRMLDAGEVSSIELIGDSITAGYGTDGYEIPDASTGTSVIFDVDGRTEYETPSDVRCWANDFRAYASSRGVASFVNRGINGWTMHDLATYGERYVEEADVIFVMLGTNDTVNHTLGQYHEDATSSLAYLSGRCKLLVVMTPPRTDWTRSGYAAYFTPEDTARVLDEVCAEAGYLQVSNLDVIQLDTDLVNADQVHPTTKGSDAIWANIRLQLGV